MKHRTLHWRPLVWSCKLLKEITIFKLPVGRKDADPSLHSSIQEPISSLKTGSTPFPTAPRSPDRAEPPYPEHIKKGGSKDFTTQDADVLRKIAAVASKALEGIEKKQLKHHLAAGVKGASSSQNAPRNALENLRCRRDIDMQARPPALLRTRTSVTGTA